MKKIILCLLVTLCLCGCALQPVYVDVTLINETDVEQTVSFISYSSKKEILSGIIPANETKTFTITKGYSWEIKTVAPFGETYTKLFKNGVWRIEKITKNLTYNVINELPISVTLQNFDIIINEKSSPCYSFSIPASSSTEVSTNSKWLGNIWDLEERNVSSVTDYLNVYTQNVTKNDTTYYYEIVIDGRTIYIRVR